MKKVIILICILVCFVMFASCTVLHNKTLSTFDYFSTVITMNASTSNKVDVEGAWAEMQKALSELERIGLVRTERTSGRYITEDEDLINAKKNELVKAEIDKFLIKMKSMGFDKSKIIKIMDGGQE